MEMNKDEGEGWIIWYKGKKEKYDHEEENNATLWQNEDEEQEKKSVKI